MDTGRWWTNSDLFAELADLPPADRAAPLAAHDNDAILAAPPSRG